MRILDLGTGSGALLLACLHELPLASGVAVDKSPDALQLAAQNASRLQLEHRIQFCRADMLNLSVQFDPFDLVISNPPYIPTGHLSTLDPDVRDFEPRLALDGGTNGLCFYHAIARQCEQQLLKSGGYLILEIGSTQATQVCQILSAHSTFRSLHLVKDLGGRDRCIYVAKE